MWLSMTTRRVGSMGVTMNPCNSSLSRPPGQWTTRAQRGLVQARAFKLNFSTGGNAKVGALAVTEEPKTQVPVRIERSFAPGEKPSKYFFLFCCRFFTLTIFFLRAGHPGNRLGFCKTRTGLGHEQVPPDSHFSKKPHGVHAAPSVHNRRHA